MKMTWILYALLALIFFSGMILTFKKITNQGVSPTILMFYVGVGLFLFYGIHILVARTSFQVSSPMLLWLGLAGLLSYTGNLFYTKSLVLAPNPGYATALVSLQLVLITIAATFVFHSELTLAKGMGIVLAIIAGILLVI